MDCFTRPREIFHIGNSVCKGEARCNSQMLRLLYLKLAESDVFITMKLQLFLLVVYLETPPTATVSYLQGTLIGPF